jgi:hypothetical protein
VSEGVSAPITFWLDIFHSFEFGGLGISIARVIVDISGG